MTGSATPAIQVFEPPSTLETTNSTPKLGLWPDSEHIKKCVQACWAKHQPVRRTAQHRERACLLVTVKHLAGTHIATANNGGGCIGHSLPHARDRSRHVGLIGRLLIRCSHQPVPACLRVEHPLHSLLGSLWGTGHNETYKI